MVLGETYLIKIPSIFNKVSALVCLGNLLFVTHGFSLTVGLRHHLQEKFPSYAELLSLDPYLPFASIVEMVDVANTDADDELNQGEDLLDRWQLVENTTLDFTHNHRQRYNPREHQTKFLQVLGKPTNK